jgi:superfamily II DNA or RNA helicase/HKD family nuclease
MSLIDNKEKTLQEALKNALPSAERVDILTAYFYFSGFSTLGDELKDKKIRILVGKAIDPAAVEDLSSAMKIDPNAGLDTFQSRNYLSLTRTQKKNQYTESFIKLFNKSALSEAFDGTEDQRMQKIFEDKLRDGSLEIRMTNEQNHAKAYILTNKSDYSQGDDYKGNVFMGSNNFTFSGLVGQGEIAHLLRDNRDYDDYSAKFAVLWNDSNAIDIQVKDTPDSEDSFLNKIQKRLWIHSTPDPYKIFIRVLHEIYAELEDEYVKSPASITGGKYSNLKYQLDAIRSGIDCVNKNNGVIIADVVGLGKSVIASAIAHNLEMSTIIITPPHLKSQWQDYATRFKIPGAHVESGGKIQYLHEHYAKDSEPKLYIIDEAHRYRNELTDDYQWLHQLTRSHPDNKVLLLTATPYNNRPQDLFAMVKLFQTPSRSTINSVDNLGLRFDDLIVKYRKLEKEGKKALTPEIREELQKLSRELRLLIEPIVIRRSRIDLKEIKEYADDLQNQGIEFPDVVGPELLEYDLGNILDLYIATLEKITDTEQGFSGARYQSASYIKDRSDFTEKYGSFFDESDLKTAQANLATFMRRLLVQRFESSKYAFQSTLNKMISSHEIVLKWWDQGYVPIQKKGDLVDPDDLEEFDSIDEIMGLIEGGEELDIEAVKKNAIPVPKELFEPAYAVYVRHDLELLQNIRNEWFSDGSTGVDPKQNYVESKVSEFLSEDPNRKIVIFSSYADTAEWVYKNLREHGLERTLLYTGSSSNDMKKVVSENFDASYDGKQKNDYDIIVATDALSEGFNLHRAGIIINYDIPYNPTRVVQRIGRINRINQKMFDKIFIYNFFPTGVGEDITKTKAISTLKVLLINGIVGSDTRTLTPDEDLRSYFKKTYDEADQESQERSWDNEYRNIYNSIKHDHVLVKEVTSIPERTRIVRDGCSKAVSISFAKRGNGILFALAGEYDDEAAIVSPEFVLPHFKADQTEKAHEGDALLDKKFEILRKRITAPHPLPKIQGRRADAIKRVDALKELYTPERDYLFDLYDAISEFDDLSNGELKYITQLHLNDDNLGAAVQELKRKFTPHYLNVIKQRAEAIDSASEIIMFTEDLRK